MTTDRTPARAAGAPSRIAPRGATPARKRPKQAPIARMFATGAALTATGTLVVIMGAGAAPAAARLTTQPAPVSVAGTDPIAPPTTITVIQPQASTIGRSSPTRPRTQTAPAAGQAAPAPRPEQQPAPIAVSTGS